jgi:hypothetical protein
MSCAEGENEKWFTVVLDWKYSINTVYKYVSTETLWSEHIFTWAHSKT